MGDTGDRTNPSRWRLGGVSASILAGLVTAGLVDVLVTLARGAGSASGGAAPSASGGAAPGLMVLALGLYGGLGLVAGGLAGILTAGVLRAIPGGATGLVGDEARDRAAATGVLAAVVGIGVMAVVTAIGHKVIARPMQSDKLATIAVGGLVLLSAPLGAAIALASSRALGRWVAPRLPRPARIGRTGLLLFAGAGVGVLAALAAFSRADWRVLDLSPFVALAVAVVASVGHAVVWYRSTAGRGLAQRVPATALSAVAIVVVAAAFVAAGRLAESNAAFHAAEESSLGLRMALRVARATSDGDGDGFSARFGGGDCDDSRSEVYPGAEDVPGNQVDENCEGGDAVATAEDSAPGEVEPTATSPGSLTKTTAPVPAAAHLGQREQPTTDTAGSRAASGSGNFKGNILLITIDALRGDRLGVAGYKNSKGRSLTPNLDALAKRGAYFKRVWSQAPNTPRSFPAILTSQYPSAVKWDKPTVNYPVVVPANHTFFEDLQAAGLNPIGIFSHFYFTADRGINKAFKEWSNDGAGTIAESNKDSASPRLVPRVVARLKKAAAARERFVMWTHLFEPHSSYMPHKEFPTSGAGGVTGLMEKYDSEIAFVDMWVGKLLKAVDELGLTENTAIVVMADHGEAWGEHKSFFHGQDLFDEQLRIPLIIAIPGRAPLTSAEPVAAVDLAPTLVDLIGAPMPKSFRGRSLLPLIDGAGTAAALPARPLYGELMPATAWPHHAAMMVDGDHKVIHRISERRWELYDLKRDPGEKRNLAEDPAQRATFERLRAQLLGFEERKR